MTDDDELIAAELAFGLTDAADRPAAEARIAADPALTAAYRRWQDYAATMLHAPEEAPRPLIWSAIEGRLPANENGAGSAGALRWWQAGTALAATAAVVLAFVAFDRSAPTPLPRPAQVRAAPLVAILTGDAGKGVVAVSFDRSSGRLTLTPAGLDIGRHSPELWVIPGDGKPRSLGIVAAAPAGRSAPVGLAGTLIAGATLAVSVEPIGGSPTGLPTGPVILSGKISAT